MIDLDCEVEILNTENEDSDDAPPELESVDGDHEDQNDHTRDNVLDNLLEEKGGNFFLLILTK